MRPPAPTGATKSFVFQLSVHHQQHPIAMPVQRIYYLGAHPFPEIFNGPSRAGRWYGSHRGGLPHSPSFASSPPVGEGVAGNHLHSAALQEAGPVLCHAIVVAVLPMEQGHCRQGHGVASKLAAWGTAVAWRGGSGTRCWRGKGAVGVCLAGGVAESESVGHTLHALRWRSVMQQLTTGVRHVSVFMQAIIEIYATNL